MAARTNTLAACEIEGRIKALALAVGTYSYQYLYSVLLGTADPISSGTPEMQRG